MGKKRYLFFYLLLNIGINVFGQNLSTFESEYNSYKNDYRLLLEAKEDSDFDEIYDELENSMNHLGYEIKGLVDKIDEFKKNNTEEKITNDIKDLRDEVEEFRSFTEYKQCYCIANFNKFIGGPTQIIKEENNVRICKAILGDFIYYYAYALTNTKIYTVSISFTQPNVLSNTTIYSSGGGSTMGLYTEIEILSIIHKSETKVLSNSSVFITIENYDEGYFPNNRCYDIFPRK